MELIRVMLVLFIVSMVSIYLGNLIELPWLMGWIGGMVVIMLLTDR